MVERRGRVQNLTKRAPSSYDNSPLSPSFGNQAEYRRSVWWATGLTSETSMLRFLLCSSSFDVCFMLCFARMDFDFVRRRKSLARVVFRVLKQCELKDARLKKLTTMLRSSDRLRPYYKYCSLRGSRSANLKHARLKKLTAGDQNRRK